MLRLLALVSLLLPAAYAQTPLTEHTIALDDTSSRPPGSIDDVAWFVGAWQGPGLGGIVDEVWLPPVGGAMPGMFRLVKDGAPAVYEIYAVREWEGTLVLDLKHFNADITGWEERDEKVSFRFIRADDDTAYFSGLTYRRVDADTLHIWLAMQSPDGPREVAFTLRRRAVAP